MLKKINLFVSIGLLLFSQAFTQTYNGPTSLTMKVADTIQINGPAKLHLVKTQHLIITGSLDFSSLQAQTAEITGPVKGTEGKFGDFSVTGPVQVNLVKCNNFTVKGIVKASFLEVNSEAKITGALNADNIKIHNLTIQADNITLDYAEIENIVVQRTNNPKQVLTLKGNTIINGNIKFESESGTINIIGPNVQIKKAVIGAEVNNS